jgi:AraC-like DNA-binding protein
MPPHQSEMKIINFLQFFWCVRGSGIIEYEGRPRRLMKNQVALLYPEMRHYWYCDRGQWDFIFFTLDGPFAVSLPAAFGLQADIYQAGPAPVELFNTFFRFIRKPAKQAELGACSTAFAILAKAADARPDQTDELVKNAVERMHKEFVLPALNIKMLAAGAGLQQCVFSDRFQAALGTTPGAYLARLRFQHALALLTHSRLPIAAVAARSGYADAHYFSRVIRRVTGYSPLQFRKLNQPASSARPANVS